MDMHVYNGAKKKPERYASLVVAVKLLQTIRRRPHSLGELAAALDCHQRTVRRLIATLVAIDVRITERKREENGQPLEYWWDGKL